MTRFNNTRMLSLAAALAATAAIAILSQANPASAATNVLNCEGNSRLKVIDCCQKIFNKHRPLWMLNSHASCHQVVRCKGGLSLTSAGAPRKCWVVRIERDRKDPQESKQPERKQPDPVGKPSPF